MAGSCDGSQSDQSSSFEHGIDNICEDFICPYVGLTSNKSENVSTADKTLTNLERSEENVRQMARNGRLQPLLAKLLGGSVETKISMASYLGELSLNSDLKVLAAQTVGSCLIDLMGSHDMRGAALGALNNISSYEGSAKVLISTGILPPLIKNLFDVGLNQLPIRLKQVSATILANIVNTGYYEFDKVPVGANDQTLVSEDMMENLLLLISDTGPEIQGKLLEVLAGLTSCPNSVLNVVSAIRNSGYIDSLVQFVEVHDNDDLRLAAIKLLHNISPHMSEELANALRRCSAGPLRNLVAIISESTTTTTEEQAAAAGLLAELPERDWVLTQRLLGDGAFEKIISKIILIRHEEIMGKRCERTFLERLVKILARITFALTKETQDISFCRDNNLASVFLDLLQSYSQDNIQVASVIGLENLSLETKNLTMVPELPPPSYCLSVFSCLSKPPVVLGMCKIHQGICSLRDSFCLVEGQAVDKLVDLLDHENDKVVGPALAALSTLLEDGLEVENAVRLIVEADGLTPLLNTPLLNVLLENRTENLRIRAVWIVERILRIEDIARELGEEQNVTAALVDAFQNADFKTKQIAENALRHIDKIPNFSGIFSNIG